MLQSIDIDLTINGYNLLNFYNPTFNLLHGPLFYFYVRQLTQVRPLFIRTDLLHLAPFTLLYLLSTTTDLAQQMVPGATKVDIETAIHSTNPLISGIETLLFHFGMLNVLSFLFYSAVIVWLLIQHQQRITRYFSRKDAQISLTWIYSLPATFLIITLLNLLNENALAPLPMIEPLMLHMLSHCCLAILLCFFGVRQKPIFKVVSEPRSTAIDKPQETINNVDSAVASNSEQPELKSQPEPNNQLIEPEVLNIYKAQIHTYMQTERPYLDPDFSVYALAEAMEIPRRTLSFVLSSGFEKNFYQFVNSYRLEEMKAQLKDLENKETILDIAFACGFSSKSTYNTLFKKQCGCTPTQFRKLTQES